MGSSKISAVKDPDLFRCGHGRSGTGTPRNLHNGFQPSLMLNSSNLSAGAHCERMDQVQIEIFREFLTKTSGKHFQMLYLMESESHTLFDAEFR